MSDPVEKLRVIYEVNDQDFIRAVNNMRNGARAANTDIVKTAGETEKAAERAAQAAEKAAQRRAKADEAAARASEAAAKKAAAAQTKAAAEVAAASAKSGRAVGMVVQNTSFQISDMMTQLEMGTPIMRVLGQQLPQVAGGFSVLGGTIGAVIPVVGTLAAISLPLLGFAFAGLMEDAKSAEDSLKELLGEIKDYTEYLETATASTEELVETYGRFAGRVREVSKYLAQVQLGEALRAFNANETLKPTMDSLDQILILSQQLSAARDKLANDKSTPVGYLEADVERIQIMLEGSAENLQMTAEQAEKLAVVFEKLDSAQSMQEIANSSYEALAVIQQLWPEGEKLPASIAPTVGYLEQIAQNAAIAAEQGRELNNWFLQARNSALDLWSGNPGSGWLSGEISDAISLARAFWEAARAKAAALSKSTGQDTGSFNWYDGMTANDLLPPKKFGTLAKPKTKKGGGGGGKKKGKDDIFEISDKEIQNLERQLELLGKTSDEAEGLELKWKLLDAAKKAGIPVTDELNKKMDEQIQKIQDLSVQLENAEISQKLFDDAIEGISSSMADAIVDGENLRDSLAKVFAGIAKDLLQSGIKKLLLEAFSGLGGGGGGGFWGAVAGIFGGARAGGGPVKRGKAYVVGENEPELFVPDQNGQIFNGQQMAGMSGGGAGSKQSTTRVEVIPSDYFDVRVSEISDKSSSRMGSSVSRSIPDQIKANKLNPRKKN